jgi:hypothetical protein
MSVIVGILLYVFGLDAATGTLNFKCNNDGTITTDTSSTSSSTSSTSSSGSATSSTTNTNNSAAPTGTSDPEYN